MVAFMQKKRIYIYIYIYINKFNNVGVNMVGIVMVWLY